LGFAVDAQEERRFIGDNQQNAIRGLDGILLVAVIV
jgi:hypothetical protein